MSKETKTKQDLEKRSDYSPAVNLHGAAIIDKDGQEVPITESMIAEAFDSLERSESNSAK